VKAVFEGLHHTSNLWSDLSNPRLGRIDPTARRGIFRREARVRSDMSGDSDQYVACPVPACNYRARPSAVREHLAERGDQRHEGLDGTEV